MDVSYKCVLEFKMPEERHRLGYALNGEKYYQLVHEMGDIIADALRGSANTEVIDIWQDCQEAARKSGVVLY